MSRRWFFFIPLLLFLGLALFLVRNLGHPQQAVIVSRMIGKPVPEFTLPPVEAGGKGLSTADLRDGRVHLVNLFASWCVPCAVEAPVLAEMARQGAVIHAIAVQDAPEDTQRFLARHGDPFANVASDRDGQMLVQFGASGVPETYVVDGRGVIRYQYLGGIRPEDAPRLLAQIEAAR